MQPCWEILQTPNVLDSSVCKQYGSKFIQNLFKWESNLFWTTELICDSFVSGLIHLKELAQKSHSTVRSQPSQNYFFAAQ